MSFLQVIDACYFRKHTQFTRSYLCTILTDHQNFLCKISAFFFKHANQTCWLQKRLLQYHTVVLEHYREPYITTYCYMPKHSACQSVVPRAGFAVQPQNSHLLRHTVHSRVIGSPNVSRGTRVRDTVVARPLLTLAAQWLCMCEYYFAKKWLTAVREAFSIVTRTCRVRQEYQLLPEFWDTGSVCMWQCISCSNGDRDVRIQKFHWCHRFLGEGVHIWWSGWCFK